MSEEAPRFRTTTVRYASTLPAAALKSFLHDLAEHNLDALSQSVRFCAERGIQALRIVSGLLPLYTHRCNPDGLSIAEATTKRR